MFNIIGQVYCNRISHFFYSKCFAKKCQSLLFRIMGLQIKFFLLQLTPVFNFIEALGQEPMHGFERGYIMNY